MPHNAAVLAQVLFTGAAGVAQTLLSVLLMLERPEKLNATGRVLLDQTFEHLQREVDAA